MRKGECDASSLPFPVLLLLFSGCDWCFSEVSRGQQVFVSLMTSLNDLRRRLVFEGFDSHNTGQQRLATLKTIGS